jgi:hypothetical protein
MDVRVAVLGRFGGGRAASEVVAPRGAKVTAAKFLGRCAYGAWFAAARGSLILVATVNAVWKHGAPAAGQVTADLVAIFLV